jgi:hypothetical protein
MKVWLDDEREAPEGWTRARDALGAIGLLASGRVKTISLDHDLGDEKLFGTGYTVMLWIETGIRYEYLCLKPLPEIVFHTENPIGRVNMQRSLDKIKDMLTWL